jgi:light-regulated signal transduction histidine kinase (bacteriophytochrome)
VEFERADGDPGTFDEVYPHVREFLDAVQGTSDVAALTALATREVRRMTGFDRALLYRFDADWNGEVIAEDRNERLPPYLGLRFPASDIPAQARELYRTNRLRLIANANYRATPIEPALNPLTGKPIDLSASVLRAVSPVHLEYMRNMGTMASLSISLMRDGQLWGLIVCHNRDPARVPYHIRTACDFVAQVLSMQLAATEASTLSDRRHQLRTVQNRLLAHMAAADHFIDGLLSHPGDLLALTRAHGAALVVGGAVHLIGETPRMRQVQDLVAWLGSQARQDMVVTDCLAKLMPGGARIKDQASGVIAVSISQLYDSYILWFRPEVIRTVSWGGDPHKRAEVDPSGLRLHPRKSFEAWAETVRLCAAPWNPAEAEAAAELRTAVVDIVLRRAEEMAGLSERLTSINKELEAFSYSVSHDLRAPFRHIVGYAQLLRKFEGEKLSERGARYIETIIESAVSAGTLVDDLLSFSQMGRASLTPVQIDMNALIADERRKQVFAQGRGVEWRIGDLAPARADPTMLRLVIQNLLENALKFSRDRDPAVIEVGSLNNGSETVYFVRDNGVGFDQAYVGKLFGVFQRLHRVEEFEGTGIGLANVKRIVERHGGRVWAEGELDKGATFFFALPNGGVE